MNELKKNLKSKTNKANSEQSAVEPQGASLLEGGGPTPQGVGGE